MKQTIFMMALTFAGVAGVLVIGPFAAVWVYYLFAVLRPQYMWQWALPPDIGWSRIVAIAAFTGAAGGGLGLFRLPGRSSFSILHGVVALFGGWVVLTYLTALNRDIGWLWFLDYLKIFSMFFVASFVIRRTEEVWFLYLGATIVLIYIAYEINSLYIFDGRLDIYHNGYGGLDNNGAGLMLAMGVPLALGAWEAIRGPFRWAFVLAIPPILHAVLMSYSRGAMVSLIVVAPLLALRSRHRRAFGAMGLALAFIVPVLAGPEIRHRFFSIQSYQEDSSAQSRFASWGAALAIANEHPYLGVGIRNSNLLTHEFGADMKGRTIHSLYFQALADHGYPGLLLYFAIVCGFFWSARSARRRFVGRTDPEADRILAMTNGLESAMAVFCIGGIFLSLEVFELPYLVILLVAQVNVLSRGLAPSADPVLARSAASPRSIEAIHLPSTLARRRP